MNDIVDARGLSCPEPLLMLQNALSGSDEVVIMVDSITALENIKNYVKSHNFQLEEENVGEDFRIKVNK